MIQPTSILDQLGCQPTWNLLHGTSMQFRKLQGISIATFHHTRVHKLCTQCAAKISKAVAMKSGRPHSIRRFAEADDSNWLTVLVRSSIDRASNDKLLDELALRILDVGELYFSFLCATTLLTQDRCRCCRPCPKAVCRQLGLEARSRKTWNVHG